LNDSLDYFLYLLKKRKTITIVWGFSYWVWLLEFHSTLLILCRDLRPSFPDRGGTILISLFYSTNRLPSSQLWSYVVRESLGYDASYRFHILFRCAWSEIPFLGVAVRG